MMKLFDVLVRIFFILKGDGLQFSFYVDDYLIVGHSNGAIQFLL